MRRKKLLGSAFSTLICSMIAISMVGCDIGSVSGIVERYSKRTSDESSIGQSKDELREELEKERKKEDEEKKKNEPKNTYHISARGYDASSRPFVLKEFNGEFTPISLDEMNEDEENAVECSVTKNLYDDLLIAEVNKLTRAAMCPSEFMSKEDEICELTDMLFTLEYFPNSEYDQKLRRAAGNFAEDLLGDEDNHEAEYAKMNQLMRYNLCAALAKASYVLEDDSRDFSKNVLDAALELWNIAESPQEDENIGEKDNQTDKRDESEDGNNDDKSFEASRMFASAELYRASGNRTYRTVCEGIVAEGIPMGFTYDSPGLCGGISYMSSTYNTDRKTNDAIMGALFADANELITHSVDDFYNIDLEDMDIAREVIGHSREVVLVDYISMSVEYRRYAQNALMFLYGCNRAGIDFTAEGVELEYIPLVLILSSLVQKS